MATPRHKNNFEFLRLIFAVFVLVTHSYELSGKSYFDFLFAHTDFQIGFSYIGVRGFFIISGYLVFQSLLRSRGVGDYFWKRILRIFPGLFVCLAITVLIIGPIVYDYSFGSYWTNREVWTYFPRNALLYPLQPEIHGVFEHNVYPRVINGSLWTICYEFTCYVALAILFLLRKRENLIRVLLLTVFAALFIGNIFFFEQIKQYWFFINAGQLIELGIYFVGGTLLAAFRYERFRFIDLATVVSTVIIIVSILTQNYLNGFHFVCMPFIVIGLGIRSTPLLRDIGEKIGDISYGIYIYGFLIQQTLMYFFVMDYLTLFFTTLPISMVLGYVSWHLIEKRALRLKDWRVKAK